MTVPLNLLESIREQVESIPKGNEIDLSQLHGEYTAQDLSGLIEFVGDFLINGNCKGVPYYQRNLDTYSPTQIMLLAEIFAEPNGVYQDGNPAVFNTNLEATPDQKPVYLLYTPSSGVWSFSTDQIYAATHETKSVSMNDFFV